ncbi:MAG TPA: OmpA family protein [Thermodesulfovibrionales bacterium]|nr:OmpA family protein [Thermodesulfovibrionales bacterium]
MSNRRLRSLFCAVVVLFFAFQAGCANMEFAPQDPYPYWYYPKELPEAGRAVEAARLEGKDKKCPAEFKAAEDLKNKAYEVYVSCRTQEAIAMAMEATAKAKALCPGKKERVIDKLTLRVHFAFDKSLIRAGDEKELKKAIAFIKKYPGYKVKLEGHTDGIGTDKYNQRLSERRAEAVKNYLVSQGAARKDKISTVGYGKTKPVASNDTKEGRAKNRRTEVLILSD